MSDRSYAMATMKTLFALGRGFCYAPTCTNSIAVLGDNDEPCVMVDIAHICAANRGGPRYDGSMTDVERRSLPNLLLLCKPHHARVDEERTRHQYPAKLLRQWKEERERPLAKEMVGLTKLTEDDLRSMLETSASTLRAALMRSIDSLSAGNDEVRDILRSLVDEPFTRVQRDPQLLEYMEHNGRIMDALEEYGPKMYLAAKVLEDSSGTLSDFVNAVGSLGRADDLINQMSGLRKELEETRYWIGRYVDR